MSDQNTIFAVATGYGAAGVAVVRISGPASWSTIGRMTNKPLPEPRRLVRRWIQGSDGTALDDALVVLFSAEASFTGEPVAELHCHGSRAVLDAVLGELAEFDGLRVAEPGEFTRRAFDNGRMDLNEVEGLGDLVRAETEFQRRQALRVMSGAASDQISAWRQSLVRARALIEVTIDWADEEVPEDVSPEFVQLLGNVASQIRTELANFARTERLREGFEVAIIGPPNVGKSTLLNAIAGRDVAITSDIAGTTRDVIEARCDLQGLPVTFLDTAGIRESSDTIEKTGVEVALRRAISADLRLILTSSDGAIDVHDIAKEGDVTIWSKGDLGDGPADIVVSALTGDGVGELLSLVGELLLKRVDELSVFGHRRQKDHMARCLKATEYALNDAHKVDVEVLAEHLRVALTELDSLSGRSAVEDVLGEVFSSFCLGK